MKLTRLIQFTGIIATLSFNHAIYAADATAEEVVTKVKEAATALKDGADAINQEFNNADGSWNKENKWVWGGTYVFVYDCDANKALAHPTLAVEGKTIMDIKDKEGKELFVALCEAGKQPHGGWVAYMWAKPGEDAPSKKVSYALQVPGQSYQVSAGIYSEDANVDELNAQLQ